MTEQEMLAKVKEILQPKTDKHDEYLKTMIPLLTEFASDKCNQEFSLEYNMPAGIILFIAKACEFNMGSSTIRSRTTGNVSYSYNTELPESVIKLLRPYKRLRFV
ncbi:phage head-tail connector protein [Bacillus gobiensis]|uniref:phage head-tail connector protein n=2 Tax=Bacillus gobiensis TaxID=1441095 RepID=UPI003D1D6A28